MENKNFYFNDGRVVHYSTFLNVHLPIIEYKNAKFNINIELYDGRVLVGRINKITKSEYFLSPGEFNLPLEIELLTINETFLLNTLDIKRVWVDE